MSHTREAAVAGYFYPTAEDELKRAVRDYIQAGAARLEHRTDQLAAVIAPHAGYSYSGKVAGTAYAALKQIADRISRLILIGPAHRVAFEGIALSGASTFKTPLGMVSTDRRAITQLESLRCVSVLDEPHRNEHALEVHLPFLQEILADFSIVPLLVGQADAHQVATVFEALQPDERTIIIVSSDLSHYLSDQQARELDAITSSAIEELAPQKIPESGACGLIPIRGLLLYSKRRGFSCRTVHLANSAEAGGETERVVGYGAYLFEKRGTVH